MASSSDQRVDELMEKSRSFNQDVEQSAAEISDIAGVVDQEVRQAVTSLQFQDMVTQILGYMSGRVKNLESLLDNLARLSLVKEGDEDLDRWQDCEKRLQEFKNGLARASEILEGASHNPVSQKSMDQGSIELF